MSSRGLVIDESLQTNNPFIAPHVLTAAPSFPKKTLKTASTQSYGAVVEQAITTQDRPFLKEIILEC
jgi:hypothetical protein